MTNFGILSVDYDSGGIVSATSKEVSGIETVINRETIVEGTYVLKPGDSRIVKQFFARASKENDLIFLDKILDYYEVPKQLSIKERLSWFQLLNVE